MGKPYSDDLRERIVGAVEAGHSRRVAARMFEVSASCAVKLVRRWRETGSVKPGKMGAPKGSKLAPHSDWLVDLVKQEPDLTLEEIRARLRAERDMAASIGAIWKFFERQDFTLKKPAHAAEQERPDVAAARAVWRDWQTGLDPTRLVFIDENRGQYRHGPPLRPRQAGRAAQGGRAEGSLEDHHLCRRAAAGRHHRALRDLTSR